MKSCPQTVKCVSLYKMLIVQSSSGESSLRKKEAKQNFKSFLHWWISYKVSYIFWSSLTFQTILKSAVGTFRRWRIFSGFSGSHYCRMKSEQVRESVKLLSAVPSLLGPCCLVATTICFFDCHPIPLCKLYFSSDIAMPSPSCAQMC